jgi:tetratricopeptide (TPR) repeat protein
MANTNTPLIGRDLKPSDIPASRSDAPDSSRSSPSQESPNQSRPHAFVVMPFGQRKDADGNEIYFDEIYQDLIKPALESAGFEPFRADEESISGDILTDMFQELLLADLVVVDMSIDNANVFYELGVRHAFRKRGIVHIQAGRTHMPFDVFNVRTTLYHIGEDGKPDCLSSDLKNLTAVTRATWASDHDAVHSPIFNLLTGLIEPDRGTLQTPLATGFWREHRKWKENIAVARRQKRIGDILMLAEEISNPLIREEALGEAGGALREMGRHALALESYRGGLAVNPANREFRREEARMLGRLGHFDDAVVKLESLLKEEPGDTVATAHLARIYTDIWKGCWEDADAKSRREAAFDAYQWLVRSIDTYLKGFRSDLNVFDPGINALSLASILVDLAGDNDDEDIGRIRKLLPELRSTVSFALNSKSQEESSAYWVSASLAEWRLTLDDNRISVKRAYRKAISFARKNVFFLRRSLRRLEIFRDLGIRSNNAEGAIEIVEAEIERIVEDDTSFSESPKKKELEARAFLFAGHMLDQPGQEFRRFPPECEDEVKRQIELVLDREGANGNDHGFLNGAACGGDIIFIEACVGRNMTVHVHMPLAEAEYVARYIAIGGNDWVKRFYDNRNKPSVHLYDQTEQIGLCKSCDAKANLDDAKTDPELKEANNRYERNIRWTLHSAIVLGVEKLRLIALWDGKSATPPDLDGHRVSTMVEATTRMGGIVEHLDITKFEYSFHMNESLQDTDPNATQSLEDRVELLKIVSLFEELPAHDLRQIAVVAKEQLFNDNDILVTQGNRGEKLFIIVSGKVAVRAKGSDGKEYEIASRKRGDCVGELALIIKEQKSIASVVAKGEILTLTLGRSSFDEILRLRPKISERIMRVLATRLAEAATQQPRQGDA